MSSVSPSELVRGVLAGEHKAIARAVSLVEDDSSDAATLVAELVPRTGRAMVIGVTGPTGVGKSTVLGALIGLVRSEGRTVGVVSVDPSSPFTSGALLGDRVRLADHFLDPEVFIRSMGTRGHEGALAAATAEAVAVLDAAGKDVVFVETAGAGQTEVDVRSVADLVVLVLMPESGDSIQALKAGLMEIPDVILVNKADLGGADRAVTELRATAGTGERPPEIVVASARTTEGIDTAWKTISTVSAELVASDQLEERRRANRVAQTLMCADAKVARALRHLVRKDASMRSVIASVERRELDPRAAADRLFERLLEGGSDGADAR
ncbi:MAG: methylmalonyl Co-A mutase-associated GTPase MeaB [Gaiellales bacterium]